MASQYTNVGAKRAREARAALGLGGHGPLSDVLRAVEELAGVPVVVAELAEGVAGAVIDRPSLRFVLVSGRDGVARQRFTLAHEFGHMRMGHGSVVDRPEAFAGYQHDPVEVSANAFAAEFLMPKAAVRSWSELRVRGRLTLEHVVRFAAEYGVSALAARYAFQTAGVEEGRQVLDRIDEELRADEHIELFQRLGLAGVDDELARNAGHLPRLPDAFGRSLLGDLMAGVTDVEGAAARLGRSVADVEGMLEQLGIAELVSALR